MPSKPLIIFGVEASTWMVCLGGASLVTVIVYPAVRIVADKIRESLAEKRAQKHVRTLRTEPPPSAKGKLPVRQTDLVESMSPADRLKHAEAEAFFAAGQIREAAQIFESIKFQRRAIDILEKAQFIDEACAVLMRLKAPHRAALLYERNHMLEKAAQLYMEAGENGNAAKTFAKLGAKDYRFLQQAADAFQRVGQIDECLVNLAELLHTEKIVALCADGQHLVFLARYMQNRKVISEVFTRLPPAHFQALCIAAGQSPRAMSILASWTECAAAHAALLHILHAATHSEGLARCFAEGLTEKARHELQEHLNHLDLPPQHIANLTLALSGGGQRPVAARLVG